MLAGLLVLGALVVVTVWKVEGRVVAESLEEQGNGIEKRIREMVGRVARREFRQGGGGLESFSERMVALAESHPAILGLMVLTPRRAVVKSVSNDGGELPCARSVPLQASANHQHGAGVFSQSPVGCHTIPVRIDGEQKAAVVFHTERDWLMGGERVRSAVRRTALRLAPVFCGFYMLLAVLLVGASRAARRWRLRAAAAERVEALGAIADGINHEIRNPLNAVGLSLQYLARRHEDPETREVVETARRQAERIDATLREFARFTRVSQLETRVISLGDHLRGRSLPLDVGGEARVRVDVDKMDGAFEAMAALFCAKDNGRARLELAAARGGWRCTASGRTDLDPGSVGHLFDPYLRARTGDVGRGLALARAVFQAHGGDLEATLRGNLLTLEGTALRQPPGERK